MSSIDSPPVNGGTNERGSSRIYKESDALQIYKSEIRKIRLISPKEEIELVRRIKRGDTKAYHELVNANLRLVVSVASKYENMGLPLLDLISEGNIGLMKAVERFDPEEFGAKLSTYARWWIRQRIKRALADQSRIIRTPVWFAESLSKLKRASATLFVELDREPTDEEVADYLGCETAAVTRVRRRDVSTVPFDSGDLDVETELLAPEDSIGDPLVRSASDVCDENGRAEILREALKMLTERKRKIISARFGLDGNPPMTMKEVGKIFGVTKQCVSSIQKRLMRRLKGTVKSLEQGKWFE